MATYVALLRGINVGGSGILPMKELTALCAKLGFNHARTFIQSGNVIFESGKNEDGIRRELERALEAKMGRKIDVIVRTPAELRAILEANPFPHQEPAKVAVVFLAAEPPVERLTGLTGPAGEEVRAGSRVIYVHYPEGQGRSKLRLPLSGATATVRNINTVAKLVALTGGG